ncbi:unnamed protein product [Paramecium sonneborni]|uniref:Uncharacterized protein n=1 Tax=Paramecium sonneborni TaxID=65129 RepID=A0A8S1KG78_9CILI|nr:unnamed protein product [Paramecium sonneborni]
MKQRIDNNKLSQAIEFLRKMKTLKYKQKSTLKLILINFIRNKFKCLKILIDKLSIILSPICLEVLNEFLGQMENILDKFRLITIL